MLNPNLTSPIQVLHKLERERYRTFHDHNYVHKSDHFYNFCITAQSVKDYVLEHLDKHKKAEKKPYRDEWDAVDCLNAAAEIANTSKHYILRKEPETKSLEASSSIIINVIVTDKRVNTIEENAPDYKIVMSNGNEIYLYQFMQEVIEYWKNYLQSIGIKYITQDEETFFGNRSQTNDNS